MKKILFTFLIVLAVSFGVKTADVHADELTPSQAATLQASLNTAEAQFVQLESEANAGVQVPPPANPAPVAANISPENAAALNTALSALASVLVEFQSGNSNAGTISALASIGQTLATIESSLTAPAVASAKPSSAAPTAQKTGTGTGIAASTAPAPEGNLAPLSSNTTPPATAEIGASWPAKELPWIAIGLVIVLIIGLMTWLSRRDKKDLQPSSEERKPA